MKQVGILYHPGLQKAKDLAYELEKLLLSQGISSWQCSAWDEDEAKAQVSDSDLLLSIGGDGTILHTAHVSAPAKVPILGINSGKLGFITELNADEIPANLIELLKNSWIEERAMLEACLEDRKISALNDVVLRSTAVRLLSIEAKIDGAVLTTYRADGVIIATATGSTGYSLAAGGPILHSQSRDIILQPISCHLGLGQALVLPPQTIIELRVLGQDKAIVSFDGQVNLPLSQDQNVRVMLGPYVAKFLRLRHPNYFYSSLWEKLKGRR
jgi:NAD+ kinase